MERFVGIDASVVCTGGCSHPCVQQGGGVHRGGAGGHQAEELGRAEAPKVGNPGPSFLASPVPVPWLRVNHRWQPVPVRLQAGPASVRSFLPHPLNYHPGGQSPLLRTRALTHPGRRAEGAGVRLEPQSQDAEHTPWSSGTGCGPASLLAWGLDNRRALGPVREPRSHVQG